MLVHTNIVLITLLLALATGLSGCSGPYVDKEQEQHELMETDREFARTSRQVGAPEAFRKFLDTEALQLPAGSDPVRGNNRVYTLMKESMDPNTILEWVPVDAGVSSSADLGYTWGNYMISEVDMVTGDTLVVGYGKYVNIWTKSSEGTWKVIIDIGNNSPAPRR